eukprot:Nk52_evm50s96 gene=Nk52_evmTU50s96
MGNLLGKKKKGGEVTSQDRAVLHLKTQRDKLRQYQKKIETVLEKEKEMAKKFLGEGRRDKAMFLLRKKKYQENLLAKTDAQMMNLEEMVNSIEFAKVEQDVLEGLKSGNDVLKEIQGEMSIDEIDRIMDDTREAIAYQNEIDEALSGKLTDEDDEAILKELDELIELENAGKELDVEQKLPDVPSTEPEKEGEEEEEPQQVEKKQNKKAKDNERELVAA